MRYELFALHKAGRNLSLDEIDKTIGMRFVFELEIEAIVHLTNVHTLLSCIMLNDKLLKE